MIVQIRRLLLTFALVSLSGCASSAHSEAPVLSQLGFIEDVILFPERFVLSAKLDTGADTSSIHADILREDIRGGKRWVTFKVINRSGEETVFERKVVRIASIKQKGLEAQKRPVVRLGVCVGKKRKIVEFTLADRSNFAVPALIGRNFLAGTAVIDSSRTYSKEPSCTEKSS